MESFCTFLPAVLQHQCETWPRQVPLLKTKKVKSNYVFFLISDTLVTAINSQFCSVYLHLFSIMINFGYRISVAIQSIDPFLSWRRTLTGRISVHPKPLSLSPGIKQGEKISILLRSPQKGNRERGWNWWNLKTSKGFKLGSCEVLIFDFLLLQVEQHLLPAACPMPFLANRDFLCWLLSVEDWKIFTTNKSLQSMKQCTMCKR